MFERYEMLEDDEILKRYGAEDKEVLEFLVHRYSPLIWKQARQYPGFEWEDLYQEGAMALIRAIQKFEPSLGAVFYSYAQIAIRNGILYAVRHHLKNHSGAIPTAPENFNQSKFSYVPVMDVDSEGESGRDVIREAFAKEEFLTAIEKECLKLYLAGYNYNQIASKVGITRKKVDNSLFNCRQKLKRLCKKRGYKLQNGTVY